MLTAIKNKIIQTAYPRREPLAPSSILRASSLHWMKFADIRTQPVTPSTQAECGRCCRYYGLYSLYSITSAMEKPVRQPGDIR